MTAQHAPGAEPQATTAKQRERTKQDIAGGVDTITAAWVGRLLEDLARAEAALVNEQAVGAGMAADVLRMSASLGKKMEKGAEAEALAARLLALLRYEHEERVGPHDCSDGVHAQSACTFLDSLDARVALEEAQNAQ